MLCAQNAGFSIPHNGAVGPITEVCLDENINVHLDLIRTFDNNLPNINA
jgi:hypothetical protein